MSHKRDYNITRLPSINKHNVNKNLNNYKVKTFQQSLQVNNYLVGRIKVKARKQSRCYNLQIDQKQNNNKIISHRQKIINKLNQQNNNKRHASIDIYFKQKYNNINSLQHFQKKFFLNKGYIHNQMIKTKSCKNSKRIIQSQQKLDGEMDKQNYKRKEQNCRKNLTKATTQQSNLLQDFCSIIYNKRNYCSQQKLQIQNQNFTNKRDVLKNSEDFPKQIHGELFSNDIKNRIKINKTHLQQKIELKDFTNYYEWRRLDYNFIQNSIIYKVSTFEQQNQRLEQFRLRNQKSLQKYFQQKEKLKMRYSTRVQTLS